MLPATMGEGRPAGARPLEEKEPAAEAHRKQREGLSLLPTLWCL